MYNRHDIHKEPGTIATLIYMTPGIKGKWEVKKLPTKIGEGYYNGESILYETIFSCSKSRLKFRFYVPISNKTRKRWARETKWPGLNEERNGYAISKLNQLIKLGFDVGATFALENDAKNWPYNDLSDGTHFYQNNAVSARKSGVKIAFKIYDKNCSAFELFGKMPGAKHYRSLPLKKNCGFKAAIVAAEKEIEKRQSNDPTDLPDVHGYSPDLTHIFLSTELADRIKIFERQNKIASAGVIMMASLRGDGVFITDISNPKENNIWFILDVGTYYGQSYTIAVSDIGWYELAGIKYLRIKVPDPNVTNPNYNKSPDFTEIDKEFIDFTISKWLE